MKESSPKIPTDRNKQTKNNYVSLIRINSRNFWAKHSEHLYGNLV